MQKQINCEREILSKHHKWFIDDVRSRAKKESTLNQYEASNKVCVITLSISSKKFVFVFVVDVIKLMLYQFDKLLKCMWQLSKQKKQTRKNKNSKQCSMHAKIKWKSKQNHPSYEKGKRKSIRENSFNGIKPPQKKLCNNWHIQESTHTIYSTYKKKRENEKKSKKYTKRTAKLNK